MKDCHDSPRRRPTQVEITKTLVGLYIDRSWSLKEISKATGLPIKFVTRILKSGGVAVKRRTTDLSTGSVIRHG